MDAKRVQEIVKFIGDAATFDNHGGFLWGKQSNGDFQMIGEVRGYGAIQNLFIKEDGTVDFPAADKFQDDLGRFIAQAITEKLEKEKS